MKEIKKHDLYEEQKGKCFYCHREFSMNTLSIDNIFPKSHLDYNTLNNLILSCPECNVHRGNSLPFREFELSNFLRQILDKHPDFRNISQEALISKGFNYRADISAEQKIEGKWKKILIEVKSFPTFTSKRLIDVITQLNAYKSHITEDVNMILTFPGVLPDADNKLITDLNIGVWDREHIANTFKKEIIEIDDKLFSKLFSFSYMKPQVQELLIEELKVIKPGRADWSNYQKHIEKILSYLFSDVLSDPITELSDKYGINRRDFILRNYCESGFWKYLREKYQADFIVIDAKNYNGKIKKNQILQLSNYLKSHGTGLFAIIISRNGEEDSGSYFTRREAWATEKKMIIILDDNDMEKMILAKASSNQPEEIIIQKIEGFRLEM